MGMLRRIPWLSANTRQRQQNITSNSLLPFWRSGSCSHSCLLHTGASSLSSVHPRSSHSWMGDPNFSRTRPPRRTNYKAAWVGPPSSLVRLHVDRSFTVLGRGRGAGRGETAGILMSAVSQWKGRQRWQPAALTCDWYRVWVWVYWRGKVAGALLLTVGWALNRGFVN